MITGAVTPSGSGVAAAPDDALAPGAPVGSFTIQQLRSRGGFADIYRACHATLDLEVAVKVLHAHLAVSRSMLARFEREARTLSRLRHPHIVDVYDIGDLPDGRPYIVMEWLPGKNLAEEIAQRGPLSPPAALSVIEEVGSALEAAHAHGVVHRDLKAANVMAVPVGEGLFVKLVDFGIAKLLSRDVRDAELTTTGSRIGTPETMSPEHILGQPLDARADVYSLAILAYQLVTGELPFVADTAVEVEDLHLRGPRPRASARAPVTAAFDAVLRRAWEPDRMRRYPAVRGFLADFRRAVAAVEEPMTEPFEAVAVRLDIALSRDGDGPIEADYLALLDDVDQCVDAVRATLGALDFEIALDTTNVVVGVARLPDQAAAACRETVDAARSLAARLARRPRPHPSVRPSLSVHVASVRGPWAPHRIADAAGPLLALDAWPPLVPADGIRVSREVLAKAVPR